MPTLVNNLRAIRGPVTAVPVTAGSGIEIAADTQNNQIVISSNLEAGSGIEIVDDNGKAKIINSDNAQALPIVAGTGVKLSVVNNQVVVSADETVLFNTNNPPTSDAINLSESMFNFERIGVTFEDDENNVHYQELPCVSSSKKYVIVGGDYHLEGSTACFYIKWASFTVNSAGTVLTCQQGGYNNIYGTAKGSYSTYPWAKPSKIIGINRLSN